MKKVPSKVAHNWPIFFSIANQSAQKHPKSHFLFHKKCLPARLLNMSLNTSVDFPFLKSTNPGGNRPPDFGRFISKTLEPFMTFYHCVPPQIFRASDISTHIPHNGNSFINITQLISRIRSLLVFLVFNEFFKLKQPSGS